MFEESIQLNRFQLRNILDFCNERENAIRGVIASQALGSINDPEVLEIANIFRVVEVEIGQPTMGRQERVNMLIFNEVIYPVNGETELFRHFVGGQGGIDDSGFFQPDNGRIIVLDIRDSTIPDATIFRLANQRLDNTRILIERNNAIIRNWNERLPNFIRDVDGMRRQ